MDLEAGYRFCNAPRFHAVRPWPERLRLGTGDAWRQPTDAELALLVAGQVGDDAWGRDVCVFAVPEHLRSLWWELVASSDAPPDAGPLARAFADFAQFKRMPLPPRCSFDVVLTPPGRPAAVGSFVAGVNLGDERTSLVLASPRQAADPSCPLLVRLDLEAGQGAWLPPGAVVASRRTSDRDVDVWLAIRGE